jgi:hypothetical protein
MSDGICEVFIHYDRNKNRWSQPFEQNIGDGLENCVRNKENGERRIVSRCAEVEIGS